MHKSRLGGFIIDCRTDDLEGDAAFWSAALGWDIARSDRQEDRGYIPLRARPGPLHVELQSVDHDSRVHLDIEADDVEAEVDRLERLGARRLNRVRDWWVMEAPSGHRFCVVPAESEGFTDDANVWPSG